MPARLISEQGPTSLPIFLLGDDETLTLGRNPSNGLVLHDRHVSRFHASIVGRRGRFFVRDQGSVNGTRLDCRLLECETPIRDGQVIRAGGVLLRFVHEPDENGQRREVRLDPLWLAANDQAVTHLAAQIADRCDFDLLPILADALEDAGCDDSEILDHCRLTPRGTHKHRCWLLDLIFPPTPSGSISGSSVTSVSLTHESKRL